MKAENVNMNIELPLVSFCIFSYNQRELIIEAIESAFEQTYENIEFIISDDASSDGTFDVIQNYIIKHRKKRVVKLIQNKQNLGTALHLDNIVRNYARGELIVVQAGDDKSVPHRVETIINWWNLKNRKDFCISTGLFDMEYDGKVFSENKDTNIKRDLGLRNFIKYYSGDIGATFAFRPEVITYFRKLGTGNFEDKCIALRAKLLGGYGKIKEPLVFHRKSGISDFSSVQEEQDKILEIRPVILSQMILDLDEEIIQKKYSKKEIIRFKKLLNRHRNFYLFMCKLRDVKGFKKTFYLLKILFNRDFYRIRLWRHRLIFELLKQ